MIDGLNTLVDLSKLDSRLAVLEGERGTFPARRAAAAEEQATGQARLAAAQERVSEAEQAQRRCETAAQDKEALLRKLENQQHQVKTNAAYTALLAEMEQAREAISEAETGVLEAMETIESTRAELAVLQELVQGVTERLEKDEKARGEREAALEAELEQLREQRREQVGSLDRDLMLRYEKVVARRQPAVAVITGELCLCRVDIPAQAFIEILRGESIVACKYCHRILIHRDQLAPKETEG